MSLCVGALDWKVECSVCLVGLGLKTALQQRTPIQQGEMMDTRKAALTSILVFILTAASLAQQVKTDYDRGTDFGRYKTFSFEKVQTQDPLWVDRIKSAVSASLTAKGLTQVNSGGDIAIVAVGMTTTQQRLDTFYNGFGGGWRFRSFGDSTTTVENYKGRHARC